ncbi:MAG TPA: hypothetical protein VMP68_00685 [Candidatus Eisenbacteria bacterium]|nr:hypothetical protein [Candidatus Eisenbacteria bacterium]
MRNQRFWIEIILLGTAVAFALGLLLASLGAVAGAASGELESVQTNDSRSTSTETQKTFEGMVTCSNCGAKHPASLNRPATVCVRMCVHAGGNFALVEDESLYLLDGDREALKKVAGQRARITGILSGHTIKVSSILAAS